MNPKARMHDYLSQEFKFSDLEIARIRYAVITIISEISKLCIMFLFFYKLNWLAEYLIAIAVLLSIRNFTGGIHFHHYVSCLLFTIIFLSAAIFCSEQIILPSWLQAFITEIGILIIYMIGPISSDRRPSLSPQHNFVFKIAACCILMIYIALFIFMKNLPFGNLIFWVIVLQILQLAAAKIIKERRQRHEEIQ